MENPPFVGHLQHISGFHRVSPGFTGFHHASSTVHGQSHGFSQGPTEATGPLRPSVSVMALATAAISSTPGGGDLGRDEMTEMRYMDICK